MTEPDFKTVPDYSKVLVQLLKGPLYARDKENWHQLGQHQRAIGQYFRQMALNLYVDEPEGYAFLKPLSPEEESTWREERHEDPPRLISQRKLSYGHTLMLVLLRKRLLEHDAQSGDPRLIITRDEIQGMMQVFFPDQTNQARLTENVDSGIKKMTELGILRPLTHDPDYVEVNRILKAKITPAELDSVIESLKKYRS